MSMPIFSDVLTLPNLDPVNNSKCNLNNTTIQNNSILFVHFKKPSKKFDLGFDNLQPYYDGNIIDPLSEIQSDRVVDSVPDATVRPNFNKFFEFFDPTITNHYELIKNGRKHYVVPWLFIPRNKANYSCQIAAYYQPISGKTITDIKKLLKKQIGKFITIESSNPTNINVEWVESAQVDKSKITYDKFFKKHRIVESSLVKIEYSDISGTQQEKTEFITVKMDDGSIIGKIRIKIEDSLDFNVIHFHALIPDPSKPKEYELKQTFEYSTNDTKYVKTNNDLIKTQSIYKQCGINIIFDKKYDFFSALNTQVATLKFICENDSSQFFDRLKSVFYSLDYLKETNNASALELSPRKFVIVVKLPTTPSDLGSHTGIAIRNGSIATYWDDGNYSFETITHELSHSLGLGHCFKDESFKLNIRILYALYNNVFFNGLVNDCNTIQTFFSKLREENFLKALNEINICFDPTDNSCSGDIDTNYFSILHSHLFKKHKTSNVMDYIYEVTQNGVVINRNDRYEFTVAQWDILRFRAKLLNQIID